MAKIFQIVYTFVQHIHLAMSKVAPTTDWQRQVFLWDDI